MYFTHNYNIALKSHLKKCYNLGTKRDDHALLLDCWKVQFKWNVTYLLSDLILLKYFKTRQKENCKQHTDKKP